MQAMPCNAGNADNTRQYKAIQGNTRQYKAIQVMQVMQAMQVMQGILSGAEGNARGWIRFQENTSTEVYSIKYDCKYKGTINYKYKFNTP